MDSHASPARPGPGDLSALPAKDVFSRLGSSPQGLSGAEAARRLREHGPNRLERVRRRSPWKRFLANFTHLMAILLWIGGAVGFAAGMPPLGVAIWLVNVINGAFSFWMERQAQKAADALERLLPEQAGALRDGAERRVSAEEIVPGDLLVLEEGERIPADARLVEEEALRTDQSALTGESKPSGKTAAPGPETGLEANNVVFAGTTVVSGRGRAVVFATGMDTAFGAVVRSTHGVRERPSPLQQELARVTRIISLAAVAVGILFFVLAWRFAGMSLAEGFIFAMGVIVAFVPEGLLPTVTLALAMGVRRMARRGALIKKLADVETLGAASVICTDKTGTLTRNEMTVTDLWLPDRAFEVTGNGYALRGRVEAGGQSVPCARPDRVGLAEAPRPAEAPCPDDPPGQAASDRGGGFDRIMLAAALCQNVHARAPADGPAAPPSGPAAAPSRPPRLTGDPTELALHVLARKGGLDPAAIQATLPRVQEYPFDADLKRMTVVHRAPDGLLALAKGATAQILERCARQARPDGDVPLDEAARQAIAQADDAYAAQGLRVLALAWRRLPEGQALAEETRDEVETDLTFLGLAAMLDPPREGVPEAVGACHAAGVRIIMITGDHALTAVSIARRLGIVRGERPRVVTGRELADMDDQALQKALAEPEVLFARAAPENKLRIVAALQAQGLVVAVTGDGVNDAPALKKADIGVSMGVTGTDAAQEASDMVLADDNFASIVHAIEEGRAVYGNIRKFIVYIFTSNGAEAVPFILFALTRGRIPLALGVMHVLLVDLGTDMLPALGLGAEPPERDVMSRPPRGPKDRLITPGLLVRAFLLLGLLEGAAAMAAFYWRFWTNGHAGQWLDLPAQGELYGSATALAYGAVVFTQMGNVLAQRTERRSLLAIDNLRNGLLWAGIGVEALFVAALAYVPALSALVGAAPFAAADWLLLLALIPVPIVVEEARKAWRRRRERGE